MKSDAMSKMPDVSPAQREQMRQMGIEMPVKRAGGIVQRVCITREIAERHPAERMGKEAGDCKLKSHDRSGSRFHAELVCDGPTLKGAGVLQGSFSGNASYQSSYDFTGTSHGRPVKQHHETSGRWIAADCGNVRPMGEMFPRPVK